MTSITITSLLNAYNIRDLGALGDGNGDDVSAINHAITLANATSPAGGVVYAPPGTYRVNSSIELRSNVTLLGAGRGTVFILGTSAHVDVLTNANQASGISNIRLRDFRVDGNRANNAAGTRHAIYMRNVTDFWIENVEGTSARADGFHFDICEYGELRACRAYSNGYDGFDLTQCIRVQCVGCRAIDNCRVDTAGNRDGYLLGMLSTNNQLIGCVAEDTLGGGKRQGYGVRELLGALADQNSIYGQGFVGNLSGATLTDGGSTVVQT